MNLLMISGDRSILAGKRGAFWYTLEEFSKHWDRIYIICPHVDGAGEATEFGNVHFHPNPGGLLTQIGWIERKGRELIAKRHHNVMTVHEYPPFYNGKGALRLHRETGIPYMTEVHHIDGFPKPESFRDLVASFWSRSWLSRKGTARASVVRVVNMNMKKLLTHWCVQEGKISVVPSFYLNSQKLIPNPAIVKTFDVVFSGRIVSNKGLPALMTAISMLPKATLLVIGDGPDRVKNEKLAQRLGIADRVTFTGWLKEIDDVYTELQRAKVFVMNSTSEGGPRILLEAMALGMPVISTNVGVAPDVIKVFNGVLTTGKPQDLARQIADLLKNDEKRKRLGENARNILSRYDRATGVRTYADALKSIARS